VFIIVLFGERQFIPDEALPYFDAYYLFFITALQHPAPPILDIF